MEKQEHIEWLAAALDSAKSSLIVTRCECRYLTTEEQAELLFNRGCGCIKSVLDERAKEVKRLNSRNAIETGRLRKKITELEIENERLNKKIAELEQDLIHADENVFYREMEVRLDKDKIKAKAVKDFVEKLKKHFGEARTHKWIDKGTAFEEPFIGGKIRDEIDAIAKEIIGNADH